MQSAPRPHHQTIIGEIPGYPETGKNIWRSNNDQIFLDAANEFNAANNLTPDHPRFQFATTLKAQAMVESGGSKEAFLRDPLQFNNHGDEADDKEKLTGIKPGQAMTPALSASAALKWLDHKSFIRADDAPWDSPRLYRSRAFGLRRYNGSKRLSPDGVTEHRDWYANRVLNLSMQATDEWRRKNPLIPLGK